MKRTYENPKMTIECFEVEDVITTSDGIKAPGANGSEGGSGADD